MTIDTHGVAAQEIASAEAETASTAGPLLDIIWNTTAICPWDCADCCVAALQVRKSNGTVFLSTPQLDGFVELDRDAAPGSIFDQALRHRQRAGLELTLEQKIKVLENMRGHRVRLDISGGDALSPREGFLLLKEAARRLGRDYITLTATGAGLAHYEVADIEDYIGEFNFTYDGSPDPTDPLRPNGYATGNLRKARKFAAAGVSVRAECPLSAQNLAPEALKAIYLALHAARVDKLLLMRLFPVGRGSLRPEDGPSNDQYREAIATLRGLEAQYGSPKVKLQCALRFLEGAPAVNPCDAVTESFGLMWDGTLLGSPWAINSLGKPIDPAGVLGNLVTSALTEILHTERDQRFRSRAAENHGHCKIFSWLNGKAEASEDRIFESADPLYAAEPAVR